MDYFYLKRLLLDYFLSRLQVTIFASLAVQVSLTQARIDMSELDEDSDGFLQPHVGLLFTF